MLRKCLLFLLLATPAYALTVDKPLPDAPQEQRAKSLFHEIRCVVCQSEAIADSPAEVARDMRREIRQEISAGNSDEQIIAHFVSRYGDGVLMTPKLSTKTAALWFGPWVLLGAAGMWICLSSRRKP